MSKRIKTRYEVIRDTREQNGWFFAESNECFGTAEEKLDSGDYSIRGLENVFSIERKGSTGEFAQNITQKRFDRELDRLEQYAHPFLILEFTANDIETFPANSGIPLYLRKKIKISPNYIWSRVLEFDVKYKTKVIFAGSQGKKIAEILFRKMCMLYLSNGGEDEKTEGET